eukprot:TRINITY_DN103931_c0_g1_i1.p2 TRINITY_DN103931_c0_g1~~TRINITY_DN103931_c0_g1_i1.p2  ORF type:complete len:272 (-),score=45.81 TRINITY_DN103931_c0_g1_i1:467-1282(-)
MIMLFTIQLKVFRLKVVILVLVRSLAIGILPIALLFAVRTRRALTAVLNRSLSAAALLLTLSPKIMEDWLRTYKQNKKNAKTNSSQPVALASAATSKSKRRKVPQEDIYHNLVVNTARLALETKRDTRLLQGGLFRTALLEITEALKEMLLDDVSTQDDFEAQWIDLVLFLLALAETSFNKAFLAILRAHKDAFQKDSTILSDVAFCRHAIAHDQVRFKIQFWVKPSLEPAAKATQSLLASLKADIRIGPPPRSKFERLTAASLSAAVRDR